jgi:hypothetical protein
MLRTECKNFKWGIELFEMSETLKNMWRKARAWRKVQGAKGSVKEKLFLNPS